MNTLSMIRLMGTQDKIRKLIDTKAKTHSDFES
jgi:hypothetical protein